MELDVQVFPRAFKIDKKGSKVTLPDPNPEFTPAEVIQYYSVQHPELTTCTIDGPTIEDDKQVFTFKTTVGTKG